MMTLQRQQTQHGFTMVELLITIGILAVVTAFATPTIAETMRKTQLNREVSAVVEVLQNERTRAVIQKKSTKEYYKSENGVPLPEFKQVLLEPVSPTSSTKVNYDFMGRADVGQNGYCWKITHKDDSNIKVLVLIHAISSPEIIKNKDNCTN